MTKRFHGPALLLGLAALLAACSQDADPTGPSPDDPGAVSGLSDLGDTITSLMKGADPQVNAEYKPKPCKDGVWMGATTDMDNSDWTRVTQRGHNIQVENLSRNYPGMWVAWPKMTLSGNDLSYVDRMMNIDHVQDYLPTKPGKCTAHHINKSYGKVLGFQNGADGKPVSADLFFYHSMFVRIEGDCVDEYGTDWSRWCTTEFKNTWRNTPWRTQGQ